MARQKRQRRARARWIARGIVAGALGAGAWSAASGAAADTGEAGAFAPIPSLQSSGLVDDGSNVVAASLTEPPPTPAAAAADPDEADEGLPSEPEESPPGSTGGGDFNDPMYPGQFTSGDLENQWYDAYMHDLPYPKVHIDWDVPITMSDGTVLKANVYRPMDWDGKVVQEQLPALVNITPYTKLLSVGFDAVSAWDGLEWLMDSLGNFQSPVSGLRGLEQQLQGLNGGILQEFGVQRRLVQSGYVQIVVDARGTGFSQGTWQVLGRREQLDDKEVVEWAADQPWSDGKVGMNGASYSGINQLEAAALHPKGLKAIFPIIPSDDLLSDVIAPGGGLGVGFLPAWLAAVSFLKGLPDLSASAGGTYDWQWAHDREKELFVKLDLVSQALNTPQFDVVAEHFADSLDEDSPARREFDRRAEQEGTGKALLGMAREGSPWRDQLLGDGDARRLPLELFDFLNSDSAWRKDLRTDVRGVEVPTLVVGGWHDLFSDSEPRIFNGLNLSPDQKKLVMGDWYHITTGSGLGKYPNPPRLDVLARAWFDHWLKGVDNGIDAFAPVTVFSQGDGWTNSDTWPRKGMGYQKLYLSGRQAGSTAFSMLDGSLSDQPDEDENGHWISFGLASLCSRDMVQETTGFLATFDMCHIDSRIAELNGLTFTSDPVEEQTVVSGPMAVRLNTVQQNKDGYWNVTVNDVDQYGQSTVLSTGQLAASLRGLDESKTKRLPDGTAIEPSPMLDSANWNRVEPGEPTPIDIGVVPVDATLQPGHRLRVDVFAGNFPKALPVWPLMDDMRLAPQMLDLDPNSPSWVVLPVNHKIPGVS